MIAFLTLRIFLQSSILTLKRFTGDYVYQKIISAAKKMTPQAITSGLTALFAGL
jgi:hypothetical protein